MKRQAIRSSTTRIVQFAYSVLASCYSFYHLIRLFTRSFSQTAGQFDPVTFGGFAAPISSFRCSSVAFALFFARLARSSLRDAVQSRTATVVGAFVVGRECTLPAAFSVQCTLPCAVCRVTSVVVVQSLSEVAGSESPSCKLFICVSALYSFRVVFCVMFNSIMVFGSGNKFRIRRSQSKASYLASYRREPRERERGLPNFEGSYKRTMSPSGGHIIHSSEPMKQKSESQDSGLDDKQSFSEGSKSPSQENLASSAVSSCDNIEMSKTLPRNYSLSLLSPTKRPMRTPRTQSDPIKATPREVIEEVAKACEAKTDIEVVTTCKRLQPEIDTSVCVSSSTEETKVISDSSASEVVSVSETERTIEEPLRLMQRTEVTLRVNAPMTDSACQTDAMSTPLPTPATSPSPPAIRHQLSEEIECDQLSRDLASQLSPSHRLQGILVPGPEVKRSTDYVTGLFRLDMAPRSRASVASTTQTTVSLPPSDCATSKEEEKCKDKETNERLSSDSAYFTTSECKARLLLSSQNQPQPLPGNTDLHEKKRELMERLTRKLSVLRAEAVAVEEEGEVNEALGAGVGEKVTALAKPHEATKYRLHVKEVGHITSLLLGLSGRLARAENALLTLPQDHADRKTLEGKRDKLQTQLEEAKELKRNIDKRSDSVSAMLYKYLTAEEYADYDHFINMKAKLLIDSREIADKIQLGEEQLAALRETLNEPR